MVRNASNIWGEQIKGAGACVAEAEINHGLCHRGCQYLARALQLLGIHRNIVDEITDLFCYHNKCYWGGVSATCRLCWSF